MAERKTEFVPVRMTPHERAALESAARAGGSTVSAALRRAIRAVYMPDPPDPPTKSEGCAVVHEAAGATPLHIGA